MSSSPPPPAATLLPTEETTSTTTEQQRADGNDEATRPTSLLFNASSEGEEEDVAPKDNPRSSAEHRDDDHHEESKGATPPRQGNEDTVEGDGQDIQPARAASSSTTDDDPAMFSPVSLSSPHPQAFPETSPPISSSSATFAGAGESRRVPIGGGKRTDHDSSSNSSGSKPYRVAGDRSSLLLSNLAKVHHSHQGNSSNLSGGAAAEGGDRGHHHDKRASVEISMRLKDELERLSAKGSPLLDAGSGWGGSEMREEEGGLVEESIDDELIAEVEVDWAFWGEVVTDYEAVARAQPQKLSQSIQSGIPSVIRGSMWQLMSSSKDPELENLYTSLLHQTSPHEKAIKKDLARTSSHKFFQKPSVNGGLGDDTVDGRGRGQDELYNVVRAYSLYDPTVGYVQGSAFIVAALLLNMPDEEAFCVLVRLMHAYGLRTSFLPEMPGLQLRLYQFDRLIEEFIPLLHVHFVRSGIKSSMYAGQWFLTLFAYRFPLDLVYRIFDIVFAEGIEAVFRFSIALLLKAEEELLNLEFEGILKFLQTKLFDYYKDESLSPDAAASATAEGEEAAVEEVWRADEFVRDAFAVKITPFQLDGFTAEWDELSRARDAHLHEVDQLRTANRNLSSQVKQLESSLTLLNTEHNALIKQLVTSKIEHEAAEAKMLRDHEDLENELIKYKILYAELSHENAEAKQRSSQGSFWSFRKAGSQTSLSPGNNGATPPA